MFTLLIALGSAVAFLVAYHTYGRWLGSKIFRLSADAVCPSTRLRDDNDYVPTHKSIVFGHHFTSIAGTGPIVGPAIAVMWGWLPALLWVLFGSIFIGAVHDFGALVVSLRNNGQTVGDIAGRVLNRRVRILFLIVLFLALTIVLAIFGLVIAAVFRQYPASIFPVWIQLPIAVAIGVWLHRKGKGLFWPSVLALALMYLSVIFGDDNTPIAQLPWLPVWLSGVIGSIEHALHVFNSTLAAWPVIVWVAILLVYCYIASVLPVWTLLQPRDYINSLQLLTALGLIVVGLAYAAFAGGAPPVEGAARQPLHIVAPAVNWHPSGAPAIFPFLFITVACGAISGFHCLVSSGTSSKQLQSEPDARFVGYGAMLTEGFLAVIVILACVAGLGLGSSLQWTGLGFGGGGTPFFVDETVILPDGKPAQFEVANTTVGLDQGGEKLYGDKPASAVVLSEFGIAVNTNVAQASLIGATAYNTRYQSWGAAGGLAKTVGAFVDGSANFLKSIGIPGGVAVALMGVLVASFAGTTLDTACRLQRYVVQELAAACLPQMEPPQCVQCGYDLTGNVSGTCPECGWQIDAQALSEPRRADAVRGDTPRLAMTNPLTWLRNRHGATIFGVAVAFFIAAMPAPGSEWAWQNLGKGGLILWPMFGATNQLLGGLAFLVTAFYLWRRKIPIWFLVLPLIFMLIMPAWAMILQLPQWLQSDSPNWTLIFIAAATLLLEAWMIVEAVLLWPQAKGVLEETLPDLPAEAA